MGIVVRLRDETEFAAKVELAYIGDILKEWPQLKNQILERVRSNSCWVCRVKEAEWYPDHAAGVVHQSRVGFSFKFLGAWLYQYCQKFGTYTKRSNNCIQFGNGLIESLGGIIDASNTPQDITNTIMIGGLLWIIYEVLKARLG